MEHQRRADHNYCELVVLLLLQFNGMLSFQISDSIL